MRATIRLTATLAGETATVNETRTEDGVGGITPSTPAATAGELTTRSSHTNGVITATDHGIVTGNKVIVTWTEVDGTLRNRYNMDATVSGTAVTVDGGTGTNLPALNSDINIALQVTYNITFDFDAMDTFIVTTNIRGVVAFIDATDTEKCVIDMAANKAAIWMKDAGFPAPMSGDPITYCLVGAGDDSDTFDPVILALYDATPSYEASGQ
jgi:hypothetical protein